MNMLDGTCFLDDFISPKDRMEPLDRVIHDIRLREKRLQEMANELIQAGFEVIPPKGR